MTRTRLLIAFGIIDIAVGIGVWAATGNAVVGILIVLVGIMLVAVPALRGQRPVQVRRPDSSQGEPPSQSEDPPPNQSKDPRPSRSEGALNKARAEQQRMEDETAAGIQNIEDRPPPTGA